MKYFTLLQLGVCLLAFFSAIASSAKGSLSRSESREFCHVNEQWQEICGCEPSCEPQDFCIQACRYGCFCRPGFLRRKSDNQCVLVCERCLKPNEYYTDCGTACPPTCDDPHPRSCTEQCVPGCFCIDGYVRNADNHCVLPEDCPKCTTCKCTPCTCTPCTCDDPHPGSCTNMCLKPNEYYTDCGTACPPTCDDPHPGPCTLQCVPGCFCIDGYVRNADNDCVHPEDCPNCNKCLKPNEYYTDCGTACPPTCDDPHPGSCTEQCVPGCFCIDGYVRNADNDCVLPEDCPKCTICKCTPCTCTPCTCDDPHPGSCTNKCLKPNEYYTDCGTACPPTCDDPHPGPCTLQCVPGCFCIDGYVRNGDNDCVHPEDCPNCNKCLKPNEYYTDCGTACPPTCDDPHPRSCTEQCVPGCFCIDGYVRNADNDCVLPEDCPKCTICKCTPCTCTPCTCDDPHPGSCTNKCLKPNEYYTDCGTACPPTCDDPHPGPCTLQCVPGCFCVDGYVRNGDNDCVHPEDCPNCNKCLKPNEYYTDCGTACPPTCDDPHPRSCTEQCVPGCFCIDGYVRNADNDCVLPEDCPKCTICKCTPCTCTPCTCDDPHPGSCTNKCLKPNEYYTDCGTACPPTCDDPHPGPCTLQCVPGCFCVDGYVRNADNDCVLPEFCPKVPCE